MSDDKSDKAGSWVGNPLPIVMVVLLAGGLLVKNVPLESARPTNPERVTFLPTSQQDVEARLWQDPFAAVEKHKKSFEQAVTLPKNTLMMLFAPTSPNTSSASLRLDDLKKKIELLNNNVTVVAVSVFGAPYAEDAEVRRRSRFAVVSALDFHEYHPVDADAVGYFHATKHYDDDVPYEWFEKDDKSRSVLVLWLKDEKLTAKPLATLRDLFNELTPTQTYKGAPYRHGLNVKLIGPAGSAVLKDLVGEPKPMPLWDDSTIEVYSPSATISNCDLGNPAGSQPAWECFKDPRLLPKNELSIVRTTGTDDVLAASLLWELWQRGVNRNRAPAHQCEDGLVLIGERDTQYGRTLLRYLNDGFSERCWASLDGNYVTLPLDKPTPVRTFSYLRGLDGMLADSDKSGSKTRTKDENSKSKDLREQLEDAPPEHAEGRNQFDYLRRLADEIDRLDDDKKSFAKNGVKAIGLVGSDVYDKLLILQALRSRFKDKIFFTTDLDARYLHADQKDWARNLVVASNFGLALDPALQRGTLPFRDSYQTARYLATLMALDDKPIDHWTGKMKEWVRPQIFEIGRTEAVHLASPSIDEIKNPPPEISQTGAWALTVSLAERLKRWVKCSYSKNTVPIEEDTKCIVDLKGDVDWVQYKRIEPVWPSRGLTLEHPVEILFMLGLGISLVALANRRVNETVRAAFGAPSPEHDPARTIISVVSGAVVALIIVLAIVWNLMAESLTQGVGEPFVWLEGVSVWPSLVIRFVGFATMLTLWHMLLKRFQQQEKSISKDFEITLQAPWKLNRRWWSAALTGPHLNLASIDKDGMAFKKESAEEKIEVTTLWQNYLRATRCGEMVWWIGASMLIGILLGFVVFQVLGIPSFPHRGELVLQLHIIMLALNALVLWTVIFWAGYETRTCARFIETLSGVPNKWPDQLLDDTAKKTGVLRAHLDDYLDFQLIVRATQRIHWLIYLPFIAILFMVISRSNLFDAMDFPPALLFVIGLALAYALHSARLLYKFAKAMRTKALENYENLRSSQTWPPINAEEINLLMERIRNTHEGAFAPFAQQPALQALLLPFGGYGSIQIIEYLFKL